MMTLDDRIHTRLRLHEARGTGPADVAVYREVLAELTRLRALVDQLEDERDNLQMPKGTSLPSSDQKLTPREASLLPLLLQGQTYKQVARTLDISPHTVKDACSRLYGKYGVQNRTALLCKLGMP